MTTVVREISDFTGTENATNGVRARAVKELKTIRHRLSPRLTFAFRPDPSASSGEPHYPYRASN